MRRRACSIGVNSLSAFVDGATLASVEITPRMSANQLRYILMGILIAGGALVPGNAPQFGGGA